MEENRKLVLQVEVLEVPEGVPFHQHQVFSFYDGDTFYCGGDPIEEVGIPTDEGVYHLFVGPEVKVLVDNTQNFPVNKTAFIKG